MYTQIKLILYSVCAVSALFAESNFAQVHYRGYEVESLNFDLLSVNEKLVMSYVIRIFRVNFIYFRLEEEVSRHGQCCLQEVSALDVEEFFAHCLDDVSNQGEEQRSFNKPLSSTTIQIFFRRDNETNVRPTEGVV